MDYLHQDYSAHDTFKPYVATTYSAYSEEPAKNAIAALFDSIDYRAVAPVGNVYRLPMENRREATEQARSVADLVANIRQVFGLNNVQVAGLVGVSRPSLYNHISGKDVPKSIERYSYFSGLADMVRSSVATDIAPALKSVLVDGKTLLGHLKDPEASEEQLLYVCKKIAEKRAGRDVVPVDSKILTRVAKENSVNG